MIIHEREAHEDALQVLADFPQVTGVFHCYSGSAEMARRLVSQGWYIGFTGVITFKNARKLVETAMAIPAGPDGHRNRLPLYGARALPGPPE